MKKAISIIVVLTLLVMSSVAYATNYSSMTEEQLKKELDAIRNELFIKGLKAENKTVIVDQKGVQIYINGDVRIEESWSGDYRLYIPIVIVNNSSQTITMLVENVSVNGWAESGSRDGSAVPAGKKDKGNLTFSLEDAEIKKISDFTDVEFSLRVYDDNTWKDLFVTKTITIYGNK